MALFQGIQVGLDLATSATIIGAGVSWYLTNKVNQAKARERGINDTARSVAIQGIQDVLKDLARQFNQSLDETLKVNGPIDLEAGISGKSVENLSLTRLQDAIIQKRIAPAELMAHITAFRSSVGAFHETAASSRYLLFSTLYSLPEGKDATRALVKGYEKIFFAYTRIQTDYLNLFEELDKLIATAATIKADPAFQEASASGHRKIPLEFQEKLASMMANTRYVEISMHFVPNGRADEFAEVCKKAEAGETLNDTDHQLLSTVCKNFADVLFRQPYLIVAMALVRIRMLMEKTNIECKRFMVNLAAIVARLLSKENNAEVREIAKILHGSDYFATGEVLR